MDFMHTFFDIYLKFQAFSKCRYLNIIEMSTAMVFENIDWHECKHFFFYFHCRTSIQTSLVIRLRPVMIPPLLIGSGTFPASISAPLVYCRTGHSCHKSDFLYILQHYLTANCDYIIMVKMMRQLQCKKQGVQRFIWIETIFLFFSAPEWSSYFSFINLT